MSAEDIYDDSVSTSDQDVFSELGLEYDEKHMVKISIATAISKVIQTRGLKQTEVAEIIGADQPKVSALVRGNVKQFSVDRLIVFLLLLGFDVDIQVRNSQEERGRLTVAA